MRHHLTVCLRCHCVKTSKFRTNAELLAKIRSQRIPVVDMTETILIADDDTELCDLLRVYLGQEGFSVRLAHDGEQALAESRRPGVDVLVLDIMMPLMNGIDVLRNLRKESELPVIMLTARGDDLDRIIGLELGADDYLAKPANPRELLARIRAILRRSNTQFSVAILEVGDLVLNQGGRDLCRDGEAIDLTSTEFSIIQLLLQRSGEVVEKKDLYLAALGREPVAYDRSIDMHVSNLRRKLGPAKDGRERIETIRGIGYQYRHGGSA
jgi:two-component system response regulator CpxR